MAGMLAAHHAIFIKKCPNPATIKRNQLRKKEYQRTFPIDTHGAIAPNETDFAFLNVLNPEGLASPQTRTRSSICP